jgi:hypothetical protein
VKKYQNQLLTLKIMRNLIKPLPLALKSKISLKAIACFILLNLSINILSAQKVDKYSLSKSFLFEENKGQLMDENRNPLPDIKYYGMQGGVYIYCRQDKISFVFTKVEKDENNISEATGRSVAGVQNFEPLSTRQQSRSPLSALRSSFSRADLILLNSNPQAQIIPSEQQEYFENFYTTGDADHGITNVHTFKTITYNNIYPHIDMVLHSKESGMKYEFVVNPGGKVSDIKLQWNGPVKMKVLENGGISYALAYGKMEESSPFTYQGDHVINSSFRLKGHKVGFQLENYDHLKKLIIDPILSWGTYYGGSSGDDGNSVSTDASGCVYIAGYSSSSGMATSGAYQTSCGGSDAYLAKFSSSGSRLWATYFGGSSIEDGNGVSTDASGNVYITGFTTSSSGFATSGAYQSSLAGGKDVFLAKFSNTGSRFWATYYGGSGDDIGYKVSTDASGNVYITGSSASGSGIATSGAYQTSNAGGTNGDAFLAKFSSSGSEIWATYYGGNGDDIGQGIAIDGSGYIYITGTTGSSSSIATSSAYQTSYSGVFLAKFSSVGSRVWATYYGGGAPEKGFGLSTDAYGNVYITGYTHSSSGIATASAYQTSIAGLDDVFLAKFSNSGNLLWATYYGGSSYDEGYGICTDASGNIYLTGITFSSSGIATSDAFKTSFGGGNYEVFLAKFSSSGNRLWATYYGASGDNRALGIATDVSGNVFITGYTANSSGIATSGAYQTSLAGNEDGFLAKFNFESSNDAGITLIQSPKKAFCSKSDSVKVTLKNFGLKELDSVKIGWSVNGKNQPYYNWSGKLSSDSTSIINIGNLFYSPGLDTIKVWTYSPNGYTDSIPGNDTARIIDSVISPMAIYSATINKCGFVTFNSHTSTSSLTAIANYKWSGKGPTGYAPLYLTDSSDTYQYTRPGTYYYTLTLKGKNGCYTVYDDSVKISQYVQISLPKDTIMCPDTTISIVATPSFGSKPWAISWNTGGAGGNSLWEKIISDTVFVVYIKDATGCTNYDSMRIKVLSAPKQISGANIMVCKGDSIRFNYSRDSSVSYSWTSFPVTANLPGSNNYVKPDSTRKYFLTSTLNKTGCSVKTRFLVTVNNTPLAKFTTKDSIFCLKTALSVIDSSKNAVYHLWDFGDGDNDTSANPTHYFSKGGWYYIKLIVINTSGCKDSLEKLIFVDSACVWPGDANFDKKANIKDLLAIGIAYKDTGSKRTDTTIQWYAHPAYDWNKSFKSGANQKHADCNGDGVVDSLDLKAIILNYGKTHLKTSLSGSGNSSDPALSLYIAKDSVTVKDTFNIDISLGTKTVPVKNIYGLCFSISYDPTGINTSKGIKTDFSKCWLGTPGKDLLYLVHNDTTNGVIDIGISRNDHKSVSGYGSIGTLSVITPDNVAGKREVRKELIFGINQVQAIDNLENDVPLFVIEDSVLLYEIKNGIAPDVNSVSRIKIYPNPATTTIHIESEESVITGIKIYNVFGEEVLNRFTKPGYQADADLSTLSPGIYLLNVITDRGNYRSRIVKVVK